MESTHPLQSAIQLHRAGNLAAAEPFYREAVRRHPDHAQALSLLGALLCQRRRFGEGASILARALCVDPTLAEAHCNLGSALQDLGRPEEALASFGRAVALRPGFAQALFNMGQTHKALGRVEGAIDCYRRAIEAAPGYTDAHFSLGNALVQARRLDEAVACFEQALRLDPGRADAHNNLGIALQESDRTAEAIEHYDAAIRWRSGFDAAMYNKAQALRQIRKLEEAAHWFRECLEVNPAHRDAYYNLGNTYKDLLRFEDAIGHYRNALALDPGNGDVRWNLALACLATGRLAEGWQEYESGLSSGKRPFVDPGCPRWDGSPLGGKTVWVRAEQGFGDTLQFVRYLPFVKGRGGRVVLECQKGLGRLLERCVGADLVVERPSPLREGERPELAVPLLSLPGIFGTTLETIPAVVPYLQPDPRLREEWAQRLVPHPGLRVGLVWAGSPAHANDASRSCTLDQLAPLARVEGVTFFSLQKGPAGEQVSSPPEGMRIADLGPDLADFADTAAAAANLDLVVTADTAVAHLAGALGRPVWVFLSLIPDWRWLLDRADSPWYPTLRLFRQKAGGDWGPVFEEMALALSARVQP